MTYRRSIIRLSVGFSWINNWIITDALFSIVQLKGCLYTHYANRSIDSARPIAWLPRSADVKPEEYFYWYLKKCIKKKLTQGMNLADELIQRIIEHFDIVISNSDMINTAPNNIFKRSRVSIQERGGHFEYTFWSFFVELGNISINPY